MMNSKIISLFTLIILITLSGFSFADSLENPINVKFSKRVNKIIQSKCYGCHNPESKNEKPRKALNWKTLSSMSTVDFTNKMSVLQNVLEEGAMPPAGLLERMPDKKLTAKETKILMKWAKKQVKKNRK